MEQVQEYEILLKAFNMGTSTAENDPLLDAAKIETQEFSDLLFYDRIDLVRGNKGSGKTAIYRIISNLKPYIFSKYKIITTFGVETTGVPVFKQHLKMFDTFNEDDFEQFWHCYFCYLAIQALVEMKSSFLPAVQIEIDGMLDSLHQEDKEMLGASTSLPEKISIWIKKLKGRTAVKGVEASMPPADVGGQLILYPKLRCEFGEKEGDVAGPEIDSQVLGKLIRIMQLSECRLWILLDRLDEVFFRQSDTEARGLKGLLRAAYRFSTNPAIRVKTFLREDIFETLAKGGFTSLTHMADRCSSAMSWPDRALLALVSKRLANMPVVSKHFGFDKDKVESDEEYQKEVFYKIFPKKIGKQDAFVWLLGYLRDGKGQVTPRDLIDLLNNARNSQLRIFETEKKFYEIPIQKQALQQAADQLSRDKRDKYLRAEFPHLQDAINSFQGGRSEYNEEALQIRLGEEWRKIVENLKSIGFLSFDSKKAVWKVPKIWHKGLDIRRGKAG